MFTRLKFFNAAEGEKIPDALNELDKEIEAKRAAADARRRDIESAAEALRLEEAESARLLRERQFIAAQMTQADKRALLRPEFDKAHHKFISVWGAITALQAQIAEAEADIEAKRAALDILTKQHTAPITARGMFSRLLDEMQLAGMAADEIRQYRDEMGRLQRIEARRNPSDIQADHLRRRDQHLAHYDALIQSIMKD